MSQISYLKLFEYEPVPVEHFSRLVADLAELSKSYEELQKYYYIDKKTLKFGHYVGFLRTRNYNIEILPKIWGERHSYAQEKSVERSVHHLVWLLMYSNIMPRSFKSFTTMKESFTKVGLFESLVYLYAKSLSMELGKGIYSKYVDFEDESQFVRGKISIKKNLEKINKARLHINFQEFSSDNKLNGFFLSLSNSLSKVTRNHEIARKLIQIVNLLQRVASDPADFRNVEIKSFSRLNRRYEIPYNYGKLLVGKKGFNNHGNRQFYMVIYDMNRLFENFLTTFIRRNCHRIFEDSEEIKIYPQKKGRNFIFENGKPLVDTIPDIVIMKHDRPWIIIDAKYKLLNKDRFPYGSEETPDRDISKVTPSDLYQVFAYYNIYRPAMTFLAYPTNNRYLNNNSVYNFLGDNNPSGDLSLIGIDVNFLTPDWENNLVDYLREIFMKIEESKPGI